MIGEETDWVGDTVKCKWKMMCLIRSRHVNVYISILKHTNDKEDGMFMFLKPLSEYHILGVWISI